MAVSGCATRDLPPVPSSSPAYDYPIANPYAATIIGTPPDKTAAPVDVKMPDERRIVVFPNRKIPEGFWYYDGLLYGQILQSHPAPLVYVIAGTGSGYRSKNMITLANTLYRAGNHVVLLPSPTHTNFIVSASENFFPGNADQDARDLYRVMMLIQSRLAKDIQITTTAISGFSLGAWHAAFVSRLDSQQRRINFTRTLLINPPLNLYSSLERLDAMLLRGLPNGIDGLDAFLDNSLARLSSMSKDSDALDFSNENLLLESYLNFRPSDDRMATIIGLTFRLAAANMILASDVMSHAGYIFPKDKPFYSTTPMNDYLAVALRTGLGNYYQDIYTNYYVAKQGGTAQDMIDQSSLETLRDWIAATPNIMLLTNRDDIILGPGELARLETLFAGKNHIFPTGGHLGNINHPAFAWQIADFFRADRP